MTILSDNRSFLKHFSNARKSYVCNLFLAGPRHYGARTPSEVVATVQRNVREAMQWTRPDDRERLQSVLDAIAEHQDEAVTFARWALEWESLTPTEKARRKAQKGEPHRRVWMGQQPATDKQRAYLAALGYAGEIASKQHASELIDALQARRKRAAS